MTPRFAIPRAALAAFAVLAACAPQTPPRTQVTAAEANARAVLPEGARPKDAYGAYYLLKSVRTAEDLPFTTSNDFALPQARRVWVAVFTAAPGAPRGLHVVKGEAEMPQVVHGGCIAVNLIADAATGETLASWCNIDDRPPIGGMPRPLAIYIPEGSPFFPDT